MATTFNAKHLQKAHSYFWWPTCQQPFQQAWHGLNQICWQLPEGYFVGSLPTMVKHFQFVDIEGGLHKESL